ncbi:hypothetical protein PVK06_014286 [Gossypium arboreum]|uniref:Uncharacterized protein n=1 Tax=Gossypium arboreum TaxID=29729 RepID=A0ABR0PU58_GOSAR|nr:hypothetical protein PVK06_014286 [Gossypium arboreum]
MIWISLGLSMESKIRFFNQTARWFPPCLATKLKPDPLPANPIYNNRCLYNNTQQPRLAIFHKIPISYSFTASAARMGFRYVSRRFLTSGTGKILSEEERAAENVFIKKMEQERLEKLARKGPKPEKPDAGSGGSVTDAKPSSSTSTTGAFTEKVSTDRMQEPAEELALILDSKGNLMSLMKQVCGKVNASSIQYDIICSYESLNVKNCDP